jgi:hypothetical protein
MPFDPRMRLSAVSVCLLLLLLLLLLSAILTTAAPRSVFWLSNGTWSDLV